MKCHAGCEPQDVVEALGLTMADLFDEPPAAPQDRPKVVARYPYYDEQGELLYTVARYEPGFGKEGKKSFRPFPPGAEPPVGSYSLKGAGVRDVRRIPYKLPQVREAAAAGGTIAVVEGEKDVETLTKLGYVATCNAFGSGKWDDAHTEALRGAAEVIVVADQDEAGYKHARIVVDSVTRAGIPVRVLGAKKGKDVTEHLGWGLGIEDLVPVDLSEKEAAIPEQAGPVDEDQDAEQAPATRRLILTPASRIKPRPVRWLWDTTPEGEAPTSHGRIPMNSLSIAAGGPGLGKSQFGIWMTAQVTLGTLPGELYGKPRSVIYAATEDSWSMTIAPRLIAAGADMDRVFRVDVADDEALHARLSLPVDTSLLGKAAEEYGVALLVADPLLSMIDKTINDYRAAEVRAALEPLVAAADRHGFAVLGLAHFTKAGGADPLDRVAGSGAFGQLIRALVSFARTEADDGTEEFVMSLAKNNLGRLGLPSHSYTIQSATVDTEEGPARTSRFVLGPASLTSVQEVMHAESTGERGGSGNEVLDWLRGYLTDLGGSAARKEIVKAARGEGFSESAIDRVRKKLKIKSRAEGFGKDKTSHWYLPEAWVE